MHVFNSLLPVFLIIILGKALTRMHFFSKEHAQTLNQLTYWVALPALLLDKVTRATFSAEEVSRISLLLILSTIFSALIGIVLVRVLRLNRKSAGAFVQGSSRANNAFVGLPVILYSMAGLNPHIEALATIALAPAIIFYNIFSVTVLLAYGERGNRSVGATAKLFVKQLLTNPLLISCGIGLTLNLLGIRFPLAIERSFGALGNAALALALLTIGSSLNFKGLGQRLPLTALASSIKVFIQPLIGFGLALLWNLPAIDRQILLIYLACPPLSPAT
jgi:predicted permease